MAGKTVRTMRGERTVFAHEIKTSLHVQLKECDFATLRFQIFKHLTLEIITGACTVKNY
jgi:hypothetical protein